MVDSLKIKRLYIITVGISNIYDTWVIVVCRNGLIWCGMFVIEAYFRGNTGEICIKNFCYFIAANNSVITFAQNSVVAIWELFVRKKKRRNGAPKGFILFRTIVFKIFRNGLFPQRHHTISLTPILFPVFFCRRSGIYFEPYFDCRRLCVT